MMVRVHSKLYKFFSMVTMVTLLFASLVPSRAQGQDRPRPGSVAAPVAATSTPAETEGETEDSASEEYVLRIEEGEAAPFDGTLFNVPAAARLVVDLRHRDEACELETNRRLRLLEADLRLQIDTEVARREALQYRHDQLMEIRDGQIQFLTERLREPQWHETGEFWFAIGAVSGIAVTVLSAYILSLIGS